MPLKLHTDFLGGNGRLLGVEEAGARAVVRFAAEPRNCPLALWFHFRVTGLGERGARCVLANAAQTLGGEDWSNNRLVWRAPGRPWTRTGLPERLDAPGGLVEWAWDLPPDGDEAELAVCFPYQLADLQATLAELAGTFRAATVGLTPHGRELVRVFSDEGGPAKPAVFLTARHHAGETPGSWALDGLLRHVATTPRLLAAATWWAVPFVDLDDAAEGSYGKDPAPKDCNRAYGPGGPTRSEAAAVITDVRRLQKRCELRFFADLHAPSHHEQTVYVPIRGWTVDSPINPIGEAFAERLCARVPEDIRSPIAHVLPAPSSNPFVGFSSTRWAKEVAGVDAACVEFSYQGNGAKAYTLGDYHRLGAALAETLAEWVACHNQNCRK